MYKPVENPQNKGGRPLKYKTAGEMQRIIDIYFLACSVKQADTKGAQSTLKELNLLVNALDERDKATYKDMEDTWPTITGLAYALDIARNQLINYEGKKRFHNTIRKGKERVLRAQEQKLQTGTNVQGVIFSMKNNYNWVDKQEVTGKDGKELPSAINISFGREEDEDQ